MTGWRIDLLGDSAVVVHLDTGASLAVNARVHELAGLLRRHDLPGVYDIVPGMCDLVVHVDPLRCDLPGIEALVRSVEDEHVPGAGRTDGPVVGARTIEIPVRYGGEDGPDLEAVAAACHLTTEDVCRRHVATEYTVCFVGFQPGFPYLGLLDESIRLPRRSSPRPRVPPGSVAIAGEYTGIYPWTSPGGWHLIGRTDVTLFDVDARPPAMLEPGMRVRFVPRSVHGTA